MKNQLRQIGIMLAVGTLVFLAAGAAWCHFSLIRAERYAKFELWPEARQALDFYLLLNPWSDQAHLLYAETLIRDDEEGDAEGLPAIHNALAHLQRIPDHSPMGAQARTQEARIQLLLLYHPARAERALRRAIQLDHDSFEANLLLWKLLDLTGRSHMAEEPMWRVYELSGPADKPLRLREWFMSQFYPATANPEFDERMGFIVPGEPFSTRTEALRFIKFRNQEPDSPLGYACLARWFQLEGDPEFALRVLREGEPKMQNEDKDPFYLATAISLLIELGKHETAGQMFDLWPEESQTGFEYWITKARVLHEVRADYAAAAEAYEQALSVWPGTLDWTSRNRKADCLARNGDPSGSAEERKRASEVEQRVKEDELRRVRMMLGYTSDADKLLEVSKFYKTIGRPREAECWARIAKQVSGRAATRPVVAETKTKSDEQEKK